MFTVTPNQIVGDRFKVSCRSSMSVGSTSKATSQGTFQATAQLFYRFDNYCYFGIKHEETQLSDLPTPYNGGAV